MNKTKSLCKQCAYLIRGFTFVNEYIFFLFIYSVAYFATKKIKQKFTFCHGCIYFVIVFFFVIYLKIEVDFEKKYICFDIIVYRL